MGVSAPASGQVAPPINDNYLSSLELNQRGTKLNRVDTLRDVRDTAGATVQTNIFSPCGLASCPIGPPEVTSCDGVGFGNTIWYDFYPDTDGLASIRTSGFDNVITLYRFNVRTLLPTVVSCVHQGDFPSEQLVANVKKGLAYTFQIGGVVNSSGVAASGPLEMLFDYSVTPAQSLKAAATLTARATATGISIISLSVSAPHRGDHVAVSCGSSCHTETRTVPRHGSTTLGFPGLAGESLPAGANLDIRVTAPHTIGVMIQYGVEAGNFTKRTFCLEPGSTTPRRSCQ